MSIYEIPERRLINTDTYPESLDVALSLFKKETLPIDERHRLIVDLLDLVYWGDQNDQGAKDEAVSLTARLLLSDPLTDQQAGAVARCLRLISSHDLWPFDFTENRHRLHFDNHEMVEIMAGDWQAINQVFSRFPERASRWQTSLRKIETSKAPKTVYRMLELHPDDVASVRQFGMIPEGLHRYVNLPSVIAAHQEQYFGHGHLPHPSGVEWLAEHLYFSKTNLLIENWAEWEFGTSSPFKLGLGTTTAENIRHRGSAFFGSYIFEIVLPANRLIAAPKDGLPEDERTVFYYIEPKAIRAVYEVEPISPATLWEQVQKQKPRASLSRLFGR
ncbi:MAG: hypothetical protein AAB548_01855 [Patescibacteria group bacterium]